MLRSYWKAGTTGEGVASMLVGCWYTCLKLGSPEESVPRLIPCRQVCGTLQIRDSVRGSAHCGLGHLSVLLTRALSWAWLQFLLLTSHPDFL